MSLVDQAFKDLGELKLWFSDKTGDPVTLADMPEIIPLRWAYFKENWEFIDTILIEKIASYQYPDMLQAQIDSLGSLIRAQRYQSASKINPLQKSSTLSEYYAVWSNLDLNSVPLTKEETAVSNNKVDRIRRFIKTDFVRIRKSLANGRDAVADTVGLSDMDYNSVYDRSSSTRLRAAKIKDIADMQNFQLAISTVDYILANTASLATSFIDPFALARANANNPDIEIQTGLSGQLVRMFFGESLQSLANRYLNNPDRWLEIAIANGLKSPYIDETGTEIKLISNGNGSQINIAGTDLSGEANKNKIYVNQFIFLQSDVEKFPDQRTILSIKEVPISGELVLELSGEPNLGAYQINDNAYIRVFKPNTINSNFLVMIPSGEPIANQSTKETPFFLAYKAEDEKRAGVDMLLGPTGDLILANSGDLQLSYGLANSLQAMQLKLISEQGQLARHPTYGLPVVVGNKLIDPNAIRQQLITGIKAMVEDDERFSRIETIDVSVEQGSAIISLVVRMAGTGSLIPLSFTINAG